MASVALLSQPALLGTLYIMVQCYRRWLTLLAHMPYRQAHVQTAVQPRHTSSNMKNW